MQIHKIHEISIQHNELEEPMNFLSTLEMNDG